MSEIQRGIAISVQNAVGKSLKCSFGTITNHHFLHRNSQYAYIYRRMNEKIQAILLKLVVELKKLRWKVGENWELDLKNEGHVTLTKFINVEGSLGDDSWNDQIQTTIDLKLSSDDQVTYFPEFNIMAEIFIQGGPIKDVVQQNDNDTAFSENDLGDDAKIQFAAKRITRTTEDVIEHEYEEYLTNNGEAIEYEKTHGDPLGGDSPDD